MSMIAQVRFSLALAVVIAKLFLLGQSN